jgi:hypothetical protein
MTASLGVTEFVPLGFLLLQVILVIAVLIWGPRATTVDREVIVRALPSDWIREFAGDVEALGGYRVDAPDQGNTLEIIRGRVPVWALVIAIVFFPFGLLALFAYRKDRATLTARPAGDSTTRIRIVGTLRNRVAGTIDEVSQPLPL